MLWSQVGDTGLRGMEADVVFLSFNHRPLTPTKNKYLLALTISLYHTHTLSYTKCIYKPPPQACKTGSTTTAMTKWAIMLRHKWHISWNVNSPVWTIPTLAIKQPEPCLKILPLECLTHFLELSTHLHGDLAPCQAICVLPHQRMAQQVISAHGIEREKEMERGWSGSLECFIITYVPYWERYALQVAWKEF